MVVRADDDGSIRGDRARNGDVVAVLDSDVVVPIDCHRHHEGGVVGVEEHLVRVRVDDHAARCDGVADAYPPRSFRYHATVGSNPSSIGTAGSYPSSPLAFPMSASEWSMSLALGSVWTIGIGIGQVLDYLWEFANRNRLAGAVLIHLPHLVDFYCSEVRPDDILDKDEITGLISCAVDGDVVAAEGLVNKG